MYDEKNKELKVIDVRKMGIVAWNIELLFTLLCDTSHKIFTKHPKKLLLLSRGWEEK